MTEKQNKCFTFYGLLCIILSRKIHKKGVKKYVQVINEHDRGKYFKEPKEQKIILFELYKAYCISIGRTRCFMAAAT